MGMMPFGGTIESTLGLTQINHVIQQEFPPDLHRSRYGSKIEFGMLPVYVLAFS